MEGSKDKSIHLTTKMKSKNPEETLENSAVSSPEGAVWVHEGQ